MLVILSLTDTTIRNPVVAALQENHHSGYQADEPNDETNRRPVPVIDVHGSAQAGGSYQQVKVRQTFVDWLRDPHIGVVIFPGVNSFSIAGSRCPVEIELSVRIPLR